MTATIRTLAPEVIERLDALPDTFKEFASTLQQGNRQARKPVLGTPTPETPATALHAA